MDWARSGLRSASIFMSETTAGKSWARTASAMASVISSTEGSCIAGLLPAGGPLVLGPDLVRGLGGVAARVLERVLERGDQRGHVRAGQFLVRRVAGDPADERGDVLAVAEGDLLQQARQLIRGLLRRLRRLPGGARPGGRTADRCLVRHRRARILDDLSVVDVLRRVPGAVGRWRLRDGPGGLHRGPELLPAV